MVSGSCGPLSINRGSDEDDAPGDVPDDAPPTEPGLRTFDPGVGTNETPAALTAATGLASLTITGTADFGCTFTAGGSNNGSGSDNFIATVDRVNATLRRKAILISLATSVTLRKVKLRILKSGGPTVTYNTEIRNTSGSDPGTTVLGTAADYVAASDGQADPETDGEVKTLDLSSSLLMLPGTYALVVSTPVAPTMDASNYAHWVTSDTAGCSDFNTYRYTTDGGSSWGAGTSNGVRRPFFQLTVDTHATSGRLSWIRQAYANAIWDPSTFTADENAEGSGGTITYDLGAGESATEATYSLTGLTEAQVLTQGTLRGSYFYVRANLSVSAPGYDTATVGTISIEAR